MPISVERARLHTAKWNAALGRFSTSQWPSYLFHSAQIEVAVEIIASGRIVCRDNQIKMVCDVANQGALGNNPVAHKFARLYFRPKNGYHLKTEGIKSLGDHNRVDPHMAVPVAFVFSLEGLLPEQSTFFTRGNFAKSGNVPLDGDEAFDQLDFNMIYHDSAPGNQMAEIHNMRMSEVVVPGYLPLTHLVCLLCRNNHEARMLNYLLQKRGQSFKQIRIDQKGAVFFRRGIFIDEMSLNGGILNLRFHAPVSYPKEKYQVEVLRSDIGGKEYMKKYLIANGTWSFPELPSRLGSIWRITIEGCIAFEGPVPSSEGLII